MSSISNNEIKRIRALQQKKFRDESGLFVVEGEKMVAEAVASAFSVEQIYRKEEIGEDLMKRISSFSTPSPVLAVVRKPLDIAPDSLGYFDSILCKSGFYIGLDAIRDPGNLGTIIRIADWFGVDAIFASPDTVDIFNPKTVQSTMGAISRVRFHYVSMTDISKKVLSHGGKVYGTFLDGENIYRRQLDTGTDTPVMVVVGNESEGISDNVASVVSDRLFIPPFPADIRGSESLNAAVATAITVAEFRRRTI